MPHPSNDTASPRLAGRTALITGASRGIGEAIARRIAAAGGRVLLVSRSAGALATLADELGGDAQAFPCDASDPRAVATAVAAITSAVGTPDVIVNNAGAFGVEPADEQDPDSFDAMLRVNLGAPFRFVRGFLPMMRERASGHLVTIGSVADRTIFPGNAAYAASKYGLRALHEVLRAELRGSSVRTTLVSPGPTNTSLWDPLNPDESPGFTPRAEMLAPEAVADAVLYAVLAPATVNVDELRLSRA